MKQETFESEFKPIRFLTHKTVMLATNNGYCPVIRVWCSGKSGVILPNFVITQSYLDDFGSPKLYTDRFILHTTEDWSKKQCKYFYKVFDHFYEEQTRVTEAGEIL